MPAPPNNNFQAPFVTHLRHTMASTSTRANTWERSFPPPSTLICPRCHSCLWEEKAFVRHVRNHYPTPPKEVWVCNVCGTSSDSRKEMALHYRSHDLSASAANKTPTSLSDDPAQCRFCDRAFPSVQGLRNHERAFHQAQVSAHLASQPSRPSTNKAPPWTEAEVTSFLSAVRRFGLKQNKLIAQAVGTRTTDQVRYFKKKYAESHPVWAIRAALPELTRTVDSGTQSSPSGASTSSSARSPLSTPPASISRLASELDTASPSSREPPIIPPSENQVPLGGYSLKTQQSLQLANATLQLLRSRPASPPEINSIKGSRTTPPSTTYLATPPRDITRDQLSPTPTPEDQPEGRLGTDPAERDFRNGRAPQQDPLTRSIHNLVSTIRQEVENETPHPSQGPSRRRLQGHLSSPSTADDYSPPASTASKPPTQSPVPPLSPPSPAPVITLDRGAPCPERLSGGGGGGVCRPL